MHTSHLMTLTAYLQLSLLRFVLEADFRVGRKLELFYHQMTSNVFNMITLKLWPSTIHELLINVQFENVPI